MLKDHQEEALNNLDNMRKSGETIALLYHATGTGKTITAVTDAKRVGKRTLFLAHTKELVAQAKKAFEEAWSEAACGTYMGDVKEKDDYVVCGSIQSVSQNLMDFKPEDFGYIVIDEAHHIAAPRWEEFRTNFLDKSIVQFTAT